MLNRFFFAQNMPQVQTIGVTFTVKEWFLDPDNAFVDTEVGVLPYMTVAIIGGLTELTDALGQASFTLAPGTYTYQVYDNARHLTTVQGEVEVTGAAQNVDVKIYACLYTPLEVWDLINNDGFVPVANAEELDGLRNSVTQNMGAGSIFFGSYATGVDKKYVQCANIDLISFANWTPIFAGVAAFSGIYNASDLCIINITQEGVNNTTNGIFGGVANGCIISDLIIGNYYIVAQGNARGYAITLNVVAGVLLKNIEIHNFYSRGINTSTVVARTISGGVVKNIHVYNVDIETLNTDISNRESGLIGNSTTSTSLIEDCHIHSGRIKARERCGSIIGYAFNGGTVKKCTNNATIETFLRDAGGIIGQAAGTTVIEECHNNGNIITGTQYAGGISGVHSCTIKDCSNHGNVTSVTSHAGGIGGAKTGGTNTNCYSTGAITGASSVGGAYGTNSGTLVNVFYDTQTSGQSDTGKGLPRTTAQMQAGTADSFINPDGTIDGTQNPANAMYTGWDTLIWDFGNTNEYPKLK